MPGKYRLKRSFDTFDKGLAKEQLTYSGVLGVRKGGKYLVEVPNRPGYYYVRLLNNLSELVIAYSNSSVSPVYDLPVIISRMPSDKTRWYIVGRDVGRYQNWGSTSYLPNHGAQHSFDPSAPGADPVWVWNNQFMPMNAIPSGSNGALSLIVEPSYYYINNERYYIGRTGTPDLTSYLPTTGSSRFVLIYGDLNGNPAVSAGSEFTSTISGSFEVEQYIPAVTGTYGIPIRAVRLETDSTFLGWSPLVDLRPLYYWGSPNTGGSDYTPPTYDVNRVLFAGTNGLPTTNGLFNFVRTTGDPRWISLIVGGQNIDDYHDSYSLVAVGDRNGSGSSNAPFGVFAYGDPSSIDFYSANGIEGTPTQKLANNNLVELNVYGWNAASDYTYVGEIRGVAKENITASSRGFEWRIFAGRTGTSTVATALTLGADYAQFNGLVQVPNNGGYYWGTYNTANTWRFASSGTSLDIAQRQADASWKPFVHITSSGTSFGDVLGSNVVNIEPDGFVHLLGTSTVYNDLQTTGLSVETIGVNDPPLKSFLGGLQAHAFEATEVVGNEQQAFFEIQMTHQWKIGSLIYPHVHFSPSTAPPSGSVVRWGLEYAWANINGVFPTGTTIIYADAWAGTDLLGHRLSIFDPIVTSDKTLSSLLMCRLFRNSSHANDNYAGDAFFLSADLHIEIDSMGSRQEYIK